MTSMFGFHVPGTEWNSYWNKFGWQFSLPTNLHGCQLRCDAVHCNRIPYCRCHWLSTGHLLSLQSFHFHRKTTARRTDETEKSIPLVDTVHQRTFLPRKKLKYALVQSVDGRCVCGRHGMFKMIQKYWFIYKRFSITDRKMFSTIYGRWFPADIIEFLACTRTF